MYLQGLKCGLKGPQIAAECLPSTTGTTTIGHSTETTDYTTERLGETSQQSAGSTTQIVYGPYNCSLPISGMTKEVIQGSSQTTSLVCFRNHILLQSL